MKKTFVRTFYIDSARKAEGKPYKNIGKTYILNGFWKKESVESFLNRIGDSYNFAEVSHLERWGEPLEYFEIER